MTVPLNMNGRDWVPTPGDIAAMEAMRTRYTRAPKKREVPARYSGATRTQYPIGTGTRKVRDWIVARYGIRRTWLGGRSRPMLPDQRIDQHQWGHAIDFMTTDVEKGTRIASDLIALGNQIGLQYIVFAGNRFDVGARHRFAAYEGTHKHRDHLHVELTTQGANGEMPWFQDSPILASAASTEIGGPPIGDEGEGSPILSWATAIGIAAVISGTAYKILT